MTGFPITGATYIREKYGPVPKLILPIRDELVSDGFIRLIKPLYEGDTTKFLPLQKPENLPFSTDELATVDYWLEHISEDHTATSISEYSHDYGWEIAPMGSIIPLSAFLTSRIREPNDIEKTAIIARAKELGLI